MVYLLSLFPCLFSHAKTPLLGLNYSSSLFFHKRVFELHCCPRQSIRKSQTSIPRFFFSACKWRQSTVYKNTLSWCIWQVSITNMSVQIRSCLPSNSCNPLLCTFNLTQNNEKKIIFIAPDCVSLLARFLRLAKNVSMQNLYAFSRNVYNTCEANIFKEISV